MARGFLHRFRNHFRRVKLEREMEAEMRFHLELETAENIRRGMSEEEAQLAARRSFGGVEQTKETYRDVARFRWLEDFWQDLRYGLRMLGKHRGFTMVAVLTLALGIGANTAIFSVVHALMLRPLPYSEPERVFSICQTSKSPQSRDGLFVHWSYPKFEMLRQSSHTMEFAAYTGAGLRLTNTEERELIMGESVTPNYFSILGVTIVTGRIFTEQENQVGQSTVVMISHSFWQQHFGGDPNVIGKTIELGKTPRTIIGVLEPGFKGQGGTANLWMPFKSSVGQRPRQLTEPHLYWFEVIGRLKRGVERAQAEAEFGLLTRQIAERYPWTDGLAMLKDGQIKPVPLRERKVNPVIRQSFLVMLAAVGFVLLIACANVASLMMTRAIKRRKELAIRLAVGATRWRIVRQLLVESVVVSVIGGMFGLLLALWGIELLNKFKPAPGGSSFWANYANTFKFFSIGLDAPVALFNFALALATGIAFGLLPAIQATRTDVNEALKDGSGGPAGSFHRRLNLREALVVFEVAITLALVIGAGLMIRSFAGLQAISLGFDPHRVMSCYVASGERNPEFHRQLRERIAALPGVESVSLTVAPPLGGAFSIQPMQVFGRPPEANVEKPRVSAHVVSQDYFQNLRIPLLRGRSFTSEDRAGSQRVAILNETAARQFFPNEDPVGKRIKLVIYETTPGGEWAEVVGVVGDVRYLSLDGAFSADVYHPNDQFNLANTLVVRTIHDPKLLIGAVRSEVRAFNKEANVMNLQTMEQRLSDATSGTSFNTSLMSLFAFLALALALIGIYGVLSYTVSERTHEIGVRMALGAQARDVLTLVLFRGLKLIVAGLAIGLIGAFAVTRVMKNLLYGVSATDPLTFAGVTILLTGASLVACYLPARRATKVDPIVALRCEWWREVGEGGIARFSTQILENRFFRGFAA